MTSELILTIAGIVLSLLFSYIPNFNLWFAALSKQTKQLTMLATILVVCAAAAALDYWEFVDLGIDLATKSGISDFSFSVILSIIANQTAHKISPETFLVGDAKEYGEQLRS